MKKINFHMKPSVPGEMLTIKADVGDDFNLPDLAKQLSNAAFFNVHNTVIPTADIQFVELRED